MYAYKDYFATSKTRWQTADGNLFRENEEWLPVDALNERSDAFLKTP
jgi:hypothetical protein